jgi:SAM-dependent methyltransferase
MLLDIMSLRNLLVSATRAIAGLPLVRTIVYHRAVRGRLLRLPGFGKFYGGGWDFRHPFDRRHHTETSGSVPSAQIQSSPYDSDKVYIYAGSQPSIIRTALNALPPLGDCAFVDLGCGKGRPLLVASEYPFRRIVGVELTSSLVQDARKNVAIISQRFPERTAIQVEQQDAGQFVLPAGNAVVFIYNPVGVEVVAQVVARVEEALTAGGRSIFVIYYNPVHGHCFDASRSLSRYFAANLPYSADELGYGPEITDAVIIWQGGGAAPARDQADAKIKIIWPGVRAELA